MTLISQKAHYAARFGEVRRSSAIFWARCDDKVKTTLSFSNYWRYKNKLDVGLRLTLRDMQGKEIAHETLSFAHGEVINYLPPLGFDGSAEIEITSEQNLRIPYPAVMAVYETKDAVSMVHSYARAYNDEEIRENRMITDGAESCWSLRDGEGYVSFAVFHNGSKPLAPQTITLRARRHDGAEQGTQIMLPALAPYESVMIEPTQYFPDLAAWLEGKPGNARIRFILGHGFTRMLCGVRNAAWTQLQVTHSNFDYSTHTTDMVEGDKTSAFMVIPDMSTRSVRPEVVVYPDSTSGRYTLHMQGRTQPFQSGDIVCVPLDAGEQRLSFTREDGRMPTRIVTAIRLNSSGDVIPAECSLGVAHFNRPARHFSWMPVSQRFRSTIHWVDFTDIYGGCSKDAQFTFNLYSDNAKEPLTRTLTYAEFPAGRALALEALFGAQADAFLDNRLGYVSVWCSYGGLMFFSTLAKGASITMEHAF